MAICFESDQSEDRHHRLPHRKVFEAGDELSWAAAAPVVDPVVAIGRGAELAEPGEDGRGRGRGRDAAVVVGVERARQVIAGEVERPLGGLDAPGGCEGGYGGEHTAPPG